ncbi:MAG: hypothetical protein ACRDY1_11760 [Acidimicrobiales bacterium]
MSGIVICSAKGSPGVTTLTCALGAVWPAERAVVVAECDPGGGDIAAWFGLSVQRGMTDLVLTGRQGVRTDYRTQVQRLPGGLEVLVSPTGAASASALGRELAMSGRPIVPPECDLLVDCGRLAPGAAGQEAVIRTGDDVLLLVRPDVAGVAHAQGAHQRLIELSSSPVAVVIAGTGRFSPAEVSRELDTDVLDVMPDDPRGAAMVGGGPGRPREFARCALVTFARRLVSALVPSSGSASRAAAEDAAAAVERTELAFDPRDLDRRNERETVVDLSAVASDAR